MTTKDRVDGSNSNEDGNTSLSHFRAGDTRCMSCEHLRRIHELLDEVEQFRAVAECTYDVECWISHEGRLVWVNQAIERITGYSVIECLAMSDFPVNLLHDEDQERIREALAGAAKGTSGNDLSFRLRRADEKWIWVAVSWQPMHTACGRCLGYRASIRDISARKQAEEQMVQQSKLLAGLLANLPSDIYWKGRDFKYLGCNEAFAKSAGMRRSEDIVGRTDYELAWDCDQADYFCACDRQVMEENRPMYNIQETERQAGGRQAVLLTSKVPLVDASGQVWGLLGIDTDISELKRVEAELLATKAELESRVEERTAELTEANRQLRTEIGKRTRAETALLISQERYRLISELTSDYAYVLSRAQDGAWHVEWFNEAFMRLTGGITPKLDRAGGWVNLLHPDDVAFMERRWQQLQSGRCVTMEYRIITNQGRPCWLRDRARPLWNESTKSVTRILGAARDITDQRHAEEEAHRHQDTLTHVSRLSMLGELTGQLAHELNQPLCTVIGNAQTALRLLDTPKPEITELRNTLHDIVAAGKHAAEVIRRLRGLVHPNEPKTTPVNLERTLEEVAGFIEADGQRHEAEVIYDITCDLPPVRGDSIQLQQVILNLVRNGLEAMAGMEKTNRQLTIRVIRLGGDVAVRIADRGTGLTPELSKQVFEPFYTTKSAGLGLGLSISRSIIEAHGGQLWAEPNPCGGTVFVFTLRALRESD